MGHRFAEAVGLGDAAGCPRRLRRAAGVSSRLSGHMLLRSRGRWAREYDVDAPLM
jgi:hypothetical protein